jgi:phosphohistidine swiveling domain-containing protein
MPLVIGGPRSSLGSKGFDLYRCVLLGANVPDFRIIPAGYHRRLPGRGPDSELRVDLERTLDELGGDVAVRSSCVDEDLEDGSRAGKFRTILNVRDRDALINAVEEVWGSADGSDMAVIVQRQLHPSMAGVLFTIDPVTMEDRTVVEYVKGVGEDLVRGRRDPKRLFFKSDAGATSHFGQLVREAKRLAVSFGYPLDIEWAICKSEPFILQARPITAMGIPSPRTARTYSRVQAEQFNSGPVSPLYFSFFRTLHERYFLKDTLESIGLDLYTEGSIVRHKDHLYFDTKYMEYALSRLPARDWLIQMIPEDLRKKKRKLPDLGLVLKIIKLLISNPTLWIWNIDRTFKTETAPRIVSEMRGIADFGPMSNSELVGSYGRIIEIASLHISTAKWGLALYSIPLSHRSSGRIGDRMTYDASRSLEALADMVRSDPALLNAFKEDPDDLEESRKRILACANGDMFLDGFGSMLEKFGHRRLARDIIHPSWKEDPMIPLSMVRKMALAPRRVRPDPALAVKRGTMTRFADRYATFREDQRFYLDMIFSKARELFVEIGIRMEAEGVLARYDDVFFLETRDVISWLEGIGEGHLAKKAEFNRLSFDPERKTPGRYLRLGVDFDSVFMKKEIDMDGERIEGEAISPGSFRGTVRVLRHADEGFSVEMGDVVVTKALDPGQTQVLLLAGALILEVGGILSHGAILARERGIPTVGQVKDATRILHEGQTVMVDGSSGYIHITGP